MGVVSFAVFDFLSSGDLDVGWMQVAGWETPGVCIHHVCVYHLLSLGAAAFSGFSVFCERRDTRKGSSWGLALHVAITAGRGIPQAFPMLCSLTTPLVTSLGYSVLSTSCPRCPSRPFPKVEGHVCGFLSQVKPYLSCDIFTLG